MHESNSRILSFNYNKGIGKKGLNYGGNINYTEVNNNTGKFQLVGPSVSFRKNFKKPKIGLSVNASFQQKLILGKTDGTITNISSSINYSPHKKHSFGLTGNALFNRTSNISIYSFNEQRLSVRYTYNL